MLASFGSVGAPRRRWRVAGVVILAVALCVGAWWARAQLPTPAGMWAVARTARVAYAAPALFALTIAFLARGGRAALLLPGTPLVPLLASHALATVAVVIIPTRLGALARPWLMRQIAGVGFGRGVACLVLERVLDLACLLLTLVALAARRRGAVQVELVWVLVAVGLVAVGGAVGAAFAGRWWPWLIQSELGLRLARLLEGVAEAGQSLWDAPWRAVGAAGLSVAAWVAGMSGVGLVLGAFPALTLDAGTIAAFWVAVNVATSAVPSPGGFGAFEAAGVATLLRDGATPEVAAVAAFAAHVVALGFHLLAAGWAATTRAAVR